MTPQHRTFARSWWAVPTAAALILTGCSGDADGDGDPTATVAPTADETSTPTSVPSPDPDVDSSGDPTAGAQDAEGMASVGTAVATIAIELPEDWQYEGTYGDGTRPYAVLVDASQPFDLSEPGSDAYRDSVWVHVETYRVGEETPYGGPAPEDASQLASLLEEGRGGDAAVIDGRDVPLVHLVTEDEEGRRADELFALHGDVWILARPSNVDVDGYVDGSAEGDVLHTILESSEIK
ncbi:hypothetical protein [Demequina activiva]|uniref:Lipoprotein n=1 Tax=Demequina activiva TaxID=1582364 RepID=A0A919Q5Q6_9MICO|nr:hypothetical protein [Demequina activiva]GIG54753.1 hypothetical protein Dac01nite_15050 [Demequina activiva]